MPRVARIKSNNGLYHIIMRGINRQTIFEDEEDYTKFIQIIQRYQGICEYKIYAYCLMSNHLHLLLMEGKEPLETVMRRLCGSYVFWYNKKYGRAGYLFQDRYKSEPVENDMYFLTVLRYIFHNPIKAGIVTEIHNYKWTNYIDYMKGTNQTEINFVLNTFHIDREKAIEGFVEHINTKNDDKCLEIQEKKLLTDDDARKIIKAHCQIEQTIDIQDFDIIKRNLYLKDLKNRYGLSIRQIERLTGISRGVIQRI
jgi:REP element-mobilizing transposase RayT